MAVKTTYTCDLCGHTQDDPNQMWWIALCIDSQQHAQYWHPKIRQLWCLACARTRHLLPFMNEEQAAEAPPEPTLEDLVREIVRQETPEGNHDV